MKEEKAHDRSDIWNRLNLLDSRIKVEFELVNHRLSWLIGSNAFMLAGLAIANNHTMQHSLLSADKIAATLTWLLPALGMLFSFFVFISIIAAHSVINDIKRKRTPVEKIAQNLCGLDNSSIDHTHIAHWVGNAPPFVFPLILFSAWGYLLYIRLV